MITADEKDIEILERRLAKWNERKGPRVGDWVIMQDGTVRRFTHNWGDDIQTTYPKFGLGSFYLGDGSMSYSGSLDSAIPKDTLTDTGEIRNGDCWFFKHDLWGAHRGVHFQVPCRIFHQEK